MNKLFLMIQNPGVAPSEAFTLLGASTKRGHANTNMIGKFGTGNKQAIGVCLRHELSPVVYAGNLRMEFLTREQKVKDSTFNRVMVKFSGKDIDGSSRTSTEDLGYVLEHGSEDWKEIALALREFVSNAIDQAIEEGEKDHLDKFLAGKSQEYISLVKETYTDEHQEVKNVLETYRLTAKDYKNVEFAIVDESRVRAKSGYTRVFIPVNADVFSFYENIDKWFLHFHSDDLLSQTILPKADRNLTNKKTAVIFRRGVRVREIEIDTKESLFDYNLEDLKLDESRQCDEYHVSYQVSYAWSKSASVENVALLFQNLLEQRYFWELNLDFASAMWSANPETKKAWVDGWTKIVGENAVICGEGAGEIARRKGYDIFEAPDRFVKGAEMCGIPSPATKLTQDQRDGIEILDSTEMANLAVDFAWEICLNEKMTNGKTKPQVKAFRKMMDGGGQTHGFYRDNTVFMNIDSVDGDVESWKSIPNQTLVTAFEEVAHHITGATDNSRDFQDFAFNMVMLLAKKIA
jgi:hypothetical protein